jgi:ATP-dependent exoDNAse (exonuclease V) beta subunit
LRLELFSKVYKKGIISYSLAYDFADNYIANYPNIIELVRQRFPFVFLDEAQDSTGKQFSLLETLF